MLNPISNQPTPLEISNSQYTAKKDSFLNSKWFKITTKIADIIPGLSSIKAIADAIIRAKANSKELKFKPSFVEDSSSETKLKLTNTGRIKLYSRNNAPRGKMSLLCRFVPGLNIVGAALDSRALKQIEKDQEKFKIEKDPEQSKTKKQEILRLNDIDTSDDWTNPNFLDDDNTFDLQDFGDNPYNSDTDSEKNKGI